MQILVLIIGFTVSVGSNVALFLYVAGRVDKLTAELAELKVELAKEGRLVRPAT